MNCWWNFAAKFGMRIALIWGSFLHIGVATDIRGFHQLSAEDEERIVTSAQPISNDQFDVLVANGQVVKGAHITASALLRAISVCREAKLGSRKLPGEIALEECVIADKVVFTEECPVPWRTTKCVFLSAVHLQVPLREGWQCDRSIFRGDVYCNLPQEDMLTADQTNLIQGQPVARDGILISGSQFRGTAHFHLDLKDDSPFAMGGCLLLGFAHLAFTGHGEVNLRDTRFEADAYVRAEIEGSLLMEEIQFRGPSSIQAKLEPYGSVEIEKTTFHQSAEFPRILLSDQGRLRLEACVFESDALMNSIREGNVELVKLTVKGRTYVADSRVKKFEAKVDAPFSSVGSACIFGGRACLRGLQAETLDLTQAEFRGHADLTQMQIGWINLTDAVFEQQADFHQTVFGKTVTLEGTRFEGRLTLSWDQLVDEKGRSGVWKDPRLKLDAVWPRTFENMELAYERSGYTEGKNEALYRRNLIESPTSISRWFWGFGVRPWRVLWCIAGSFVLFCALYFTQVPRSFGFWERWQAAVAFSARTAWHFGYGPQRSRGALWKAVTATQMVGFKVMALLFLKGMANTSPLLNELASKLIHL